MNSIKLVFVFLLLTNLFLAESFESKNDLVSNNIDNVQQPAILNDEEDINSIEKRQIRSRIRQRRRKAAQRRRNQQRNIQDIKNALTQLQTQMNNIFTRLDSNNITVQPG